MPATGLLDNTSEVVNRLRNKLVPEEVEIDYILVFCIAEGAITGVKPIPRSWCGGCFRVPPQCPRCILRRRRPGL